MPKVPRAKPTRAPHASTTKKKTKPPTSTANDLVPLPTTPIMTAPHATRMTYAIARGEVGVLTFEPYKSFLLPLWRFRTPAVARSSAAALTRRFHEYDAAGDFVGMDMARKFLQMGMTRSMRYANHRGGRKYVKVKEGEGVRDVEGKGVKVDEDGNLKVELEKDEGFEGQEEKLESAEVFRKAWRAVKEVEGYAVRRKEWEAEKKAWVKEGGVVIKKDGVEKEAVKKEMVKKEDEDGDGKSAKE